MAKALYRQYRPKTFNQVLGQDRVVNVLKNQIKSGKISHAYLFSGERGTGKTSCAKIFAKAANCLNPIDGSPCLECENCKTIEEETTIDVVEMDAASNRRIDDIRNLKDNVIYPPNKLKYKVYIIDEAHMITKEAFNALLKIMEEPPSHLIFILATTEIEKVPNTILSRVQKFEFNKIDQNQIKNQIESILSDKNITMEKEAIDLIINKANGAMRDALSILDQVISLEDSSYTISDVENILGVVDFYLIDKLTESIISKNPKASLENLFTIRNEGKSNKDILDSLIGYFNDIMVYKMTGDEKYFENKERLTFIRDRSNQITDLDVGDYLDILIDYTNKLKISENTDVLTEVALLRLVNLKNISSIESRVRYLEKNLDGDLVDTVNKIVDNRMSSFDLNDLSINKKSIDKKTNNKEKTINNVNIDSVVENKENLPSKAKDDNKGSSKDIDNNQPSSESSKRLSTSDEVKVKQMIIETAGGAINGLYSDEGFNYDIIDNEFIMYIKDDYYKIFIATKLGDIEKNLSEILKNNIKFTIGTKETVDFEKNEAIDSDIDQSSKENVENKPDYSDKLRDIFGKELIIE